MWIIHIWMTKRKYSKFVVMHFYFDANFNEIRTSSTFKTTLHTLASRCAAWWANHHLPQNIFARAVWLLLLFSFFGRKTEQSKHRIRSHAAAYVCSMCNVYIENEKSTARLYLLTSTVIDTQNSPVIECFIVVLIGNCVYCYHSRLSIHLFQSIGRWPPLNYCQQSCIVDLTNP